MLDAPSRQVCLEGGVWDLRADHRAWYLLELLTKKSYRWTIRRFLNRKSYKLEPLYLLLWAFSARHRVDFKLQIPVTDDDRTLGAIFPVAFLDKLPNNVDSVAALKMACMELLEEAGLISYNTAPTTPDDGAAPPGGENFTTAALPSTGAAAPSTP